MKTGGEEWNARGPCGGVMMPRGTAWAGKAETLPKAGRRLEPEGAPRVIEAVRVREADISPGGAIRAWPD